MAPTDTDRVIILVDMDCFYCQVEEGLNPNLNGKPIAVVQYNQWQGGGIIAVNYPARGQGVTRHMRGGEAKEKCPTIELVSVPTKRGKADTSRYRNAGKRVAEVLLTFSSSLERASVDEAYLDVTEYVHERMNTACPRLTESQLQNTHVVGFDSIQNFLEEVYDTELSNDVMLRLTIGAAMAEEIRTAVYAKTGYKCSAGIAHNKLLAKLVCGLHKPNQQTVLPQDGVAELYERMPVRKIQSMGGKFGTNVTDSLNIEYMGQLIKFSEKELRQHFDEKTSQWLYLLARGIEHSPVTVRLRSQSVGCCKKFPGPSALTSMAELRPWMEDLVAELHERLVEDREEYGRRARHLVVSVCYVPPDLLKEKRKVGRKDEVSQSRSVSMVVDWEIGDGARTTEDCLSILRKCSALPAIVQDNDSKVFSIRFLGLSAGKFEVIQKNQASISSFLTTKSIDANKLIESTTVLEKPLENFVQLQEKCLTNLEIEQDVKSDRAIVLNNSSLKLESSLLKDMRNTGKPSCSQATRNKSKKLGKKPSNSFFFNYFQNKDQDPSTSGNKDFNTNSSINNPWDDTNIAQESIAVEQESSQQIDDSRTICSECNKPIALDNVESHSDYHFAIKLVKEESHSYFKNVTLTQNTSTSDARFKRASGKRKSSETVNCKSIDSFFINKKERSEHSSSQKCDECEMFILETDLEMHKDYHVAKKLYSEINADIKPHSYGKKVPVVMQHKKSRCDTKSISTYFKPK